MDNPIVHWELLVSDLGKAREFYTNVFGWKVEDNPAFPGYPMVDPGRDPRGAMMAKPPDRAVREQDGRRGGRRGPGTVRSGPPPAVA